MIGRRRLVVLATGAVAGCAAVGIATREPPQLFQLTPKSTFDPGLPDLGRLPLLVEVPTAAGGLNTARIALKPTPTLVQYYAGATWTEVLPVMLHQLIIESFDNTGSIDALDRVTGVNRAAWALVVYIREFQPEYVDTEQPPTVNVRLQARLLRLPRREEAAFSSFEATWPAEDTDLLSIVVAIDEALGVVLKNMVQWTLRSIAGVEV